MLRTKTTVTVAITAPVVTSNAEFVKHAEAKRVGKERKQFGASRVLAYLLLVLCASYSYWVMSLMFSSSIVTPDTIEESNKRASGILQDKTVGAESMHPRHHIVFSTGCSQSQDWQSYVFFYHAMRVKQSGTVSRIASGCTSEQQERLQRFHARAIRSMSPNFFIHYTPDFSLVKENASYIYFNKPFGLKHWLEHGPLDISNGGKNEDDIVMLLDPDQILLKPLTHDFSHDDDLWFELDNDQQPLKVQNGRPFAQLYGFEDQWRTRVNLTHVLNGQASPILNLTKEQALAHYPGGPPYIATARDMYRISVVWSDFCPRVHDSYPHLLGEMFSYSLAAAHLQLPHRLSRSFMLSSAQDPYSEAWDEILEPVKDLDICHHESSIPRVLHYCQLYRVGLWQFNKHTWDGDLFSNCDAPLFEEPYANITHYDYWTNGEKKFNLTAQSEKEKQRDSFMTCKALQKINQAAIYYKQTQCLDKTLVAATMTYRQGWSY